MIPNDPSDFSQSDLARFMDGARIALTITSCDIEDHPLIYANDRFCELTGFDRERILDRNCRFMQREMREQDGRFRMRAFMRDSSQDRMRCALVNFRADGSAFINLVYLSRIRTSTKKQCYIFASQFDASYDHATRFDRYEADLRTTAMRMRKIASEHDLMMDQSVDIIANSAAMIAQSKLVLKSLDNTH